EMRRTMKKRLCLLLVTSAIGIVGASGCCRYCCRPPEYTASAPPCADPCPPGILRPFHALTPRRYDVVPGPVPPTRVDVLPPAAARWPRAGARAPAGAEPDGAHASGATRSARAARPAAGHPRLRLAAGAAARAIVAPVARRQALGVAPGNAARPGAPVSAGDA